MAHDVSIAGQAYRVRSPVAVLLLTAVTLFVYSVVWFYKVNDEARRYLRDASINPWHSVLAIVPGLLLIIPPFVAIYRTGERLRRMEQHVGLTKTVNPTAGTILGFLATLTLLFAGGSGSYYQTHLNAVWATHRPHPSPDPS